MDNKTQQTQQNAQNTQRMRYSNDELMVLNGAFAEKYDLLVLLRKFLLQGELSEAEKELVKFFASDNLYPILRKTYLPEIDLTTPIGQLVDLWTNINTKEKTPEGTELEMKARAIVVDYLAQRFNELKGGEQGELKFSELEYSPDRDAVDNHITLSARNTIISHVDFQTGQLWILAGEKKETLQEIQTRLFKNSNK